LIELRRLVYTIQDRHILRGVDMRVERGETFAVVGYSGVGKSTLLKCIAGLLEPASGEVIIDGVNIVGMPESKLRPIRAKIGMVFQNAALFDSLTVYENVSFGLRHQRKLPEDEIRKIVAEKLALVGLSNTENLYPSQLSGGMQKRVGIARALAVNPEILLYDEPTSGLDPVMSAVIGDLIVRLRDNLGVTTVVVSHDVVLTKKVANRIGMLHRGRICMVGTWDEIETTDNPVVRQFISGSIEGPVKV